MDWLDQLLGLLAAAWAYWQFKWIVCHVAINLVVAVAVSVAKGDFVLAKTAEFLYKKLLPYVAVFFVVQVLGEAAELAWLGTATWTAITAALASDLLDNLKKLGLPVPEGLTKERVNGRY